MDIREFQGPSRSFFDRVGVVPVRISSGGQAPRFALHQAQAHEILDRMVGQGLVEADAAAATRGEFAELPESFEGFIDRVIDVRIDEPVGPVAYVHCPNCGLHGELMEGDWLVAGPIMTLADGLLAVQVGVDRRLFTAPQAVLMLQAMHHSGLPLVDYPEATDFALPAKALFRVSLHSMRLRPAQRVWEIELFGGAIILKAGFRGR